MQLVETLERRLRRSRFVVAWGGLTSRGPPWVAVRGAPRWANERALSNFKFGNEIRCWPTVQVALTPTLLPLIPESRILDFFLIEWNKTHRFVSPLNPPPSKKCADSYVKWKLFDDSHRENQWYVVFFLGYICIEFNKEAGDSHECLKDG